MNSIIDRVWYVWQSASGQHVETDVTWLCEHDAQQWSLVRKAQKPIMRKSLCWSTEKDETIHSYDFTDGQFEVEALPDRSGILVVKNNTLGCGREYSEAFVINSNGKQRFSLDGSKIRTFQGFNSIRTTHTSCENVRVYIILQDSSDAYGFTGGYCIDGSESDLSKVPLMPIMS